jgi:phosphoribosyl-ATP pyrophosphohydrolase
MVQSLNVNPGPDDERIESMSDDGSVFTRLMTVIEDRVRRRPPGSYTTQLVQGGMDAIGAKIREEAAELVEAGCLAGREARHAAVIHEAADLIYHLFAMLGFCGVPLAEIEAELGRRFGVSGLEEKASRRPC